MVKFIEKHHKNDETIFWPDLALCKENVGMVGAKKHQNSAPNVPQARPTEYFWAMLSGAVYAKGCETKNKAELCGGIKR
jgi:hypothetical protein